MPELPEVEHVRRGLEAARLRRPVSTLWRSEYDLRTGATWARTNEHLSWLEGARPGALTRRGKYILWAFESPKGDQLEALIHLGMTGRCRIVRRGDPREAHTHISLTFEDERRFDFVDPRRFGGFVVDRPATLRGREPLLSMGPEPLGSDFDAASLAARAGRSRRVIRQALLDQSVVAGLGNIYVSEALFVARIPPLARCHRLRVTAWQRLADAIVEVLERSLARGGTTLRDYRRVDGSSGENQLALLAYGRQGESCVSCATELVAHQWQGRSGAHCPRCQKPGPGGWVR
jgi:formamidopyrimidine-DNA glycosylase